MRRHGPRDFDIPLIVRQRPIFGCVGPEFVQGQSEGKRRLRTKKPEPAKSEVQERHADPHAIRALARASTQGHTDRMTTTQEQIARTIDRMATSQEQMTRSLDQLTADREQMTREITKLQEIEQSIRLRNSQPSLRPVSASASAPKPVSRPAFASTPKPISPTPILPEPTVP